MGVSFVVYVDESGDEGFEFALGSSQWLILSAAIFRKDTEREEVALVREVCDLLKKKASKGLHFADLKHVQRIPYIDRISRARIRSISVAVHKPSLGEPEVFQAEKHRLYIHAIRYLVERVSWFCRDTRKRNDSGDGTAEIVFSHRRGMSYESIKSYLDRLRGTDTEIYWEAIETPRIYALPHKQRMGLQIADAIASSVFQGLEKNRFGYTEDRYIRTLAPIVWRREGKCRGYGLKIWPVEAEAKLELESQHAWIKAFWK